MLTAADTAELIRGLLAELLEDSTVASLPDETPLFGAGLELSSLTGAGLLVRIWTETNVDIAAEDLALESLETIGTLWRYVVDRQR